MVGTLDVAVQAQNPQNPLFPLVAYEKSSSSVRIRNVPKKIGSWNITSVVLAAQYPDNTTKAAQCVLVGGIWIGTIAGSEDVGDGVYTIYASGIDENGQPVNDYCLGSGQVTILAQEVRRDANAPVHMLYEEPTAEIREGDLFQSGETSSWMIFKDGQSVPIVELSDYYQKSETSSAAEISTAFENIDLSDCIKYPVLDAQTNEWTLSISPQDGELDDKQKIVLGSYEESVPGEYSTYIRIGDAARLGVTRDTPVSAEAGYPRLKLGTQTIPLFRDMPKKTSQLSNDSEFPTPDNPGRFLRYTAYPSHPDRWIVNFGSSSAGGISLVSDGENPISSYIDIAGRRITAGGEDQQVVQGRLASAGLASVNPTDYIAVDDRPLAFVDQLSDYYKKSETSSAAEISTAFENIDLSDYVEKASLSDYYQKSETSSAAEISTAFENIDLSEYATKDEVSSLSDAVKFEADNDSNKTAVTIGTRIAGIGAQSLAVGTNNGVNGSRAFAVGAYNSVLSNDSAAIGASNTVRDTKSLAVGYTNNISAQNSLAVGAGVIVNGNNSFAVGVETSALGPDSFAGGNHTRASQTGSFAWGNQILADSPLEASFGRLNKSHVYDYSLSNEASATIFSVGVGGLSGNERANGLEVMLNGDTWMKGLGGYDGANLSTGIPLQQMFGTQFVLSGEYEDDTTFEISVYGCTPPPPPPPKWFTLKNVGSSSGSAAANLTSFNLEYSTDGGDSWSAYSSGTSLTLDPDGEVKFRHTGTDSTGKHITFSTTGDLAVSGNIMTLLDETGESIALTDESIFESMFQNQTIVDASELELPATTLTNYCYKNMFYNCDSLTASPLVLPAQSLATQAYYMMFAYSDALSSGPEIMALNINFSNSMNGIFNSCHNLSSVTVHITDWQTNHAGTANWLNNTAEYGTFYCPAALGTNETITRGLGRCPNNWTVVNI